MGKVLPAAKKGLPQIAQINTDYLRLMHYSFRNYLKQYL